MSYFPDTKDALSPPQLSDAGALALTDLQVINRSGADFSHQLAALVTLVRKTPKPSRTAALPAVLTATDNDGIVKLTGTTGTLSCDNTVPDGLKCLVVNIASGVATFSGITGLLNSAGIAPSSSATIFQCGGINYATTGTAASGSASAYSMTESATVGLNGTAVTLTFAPSNGTWPSGVTLTPAAATVAGTFSPTTLSPTAGLTTAVTCTFTPSATGTATFSVTSGGAMTNPANLTYVSNATATAYTTGLSASSGLTNAAITITCTPTSGGWPNSEVITPTLSGVSGSFSPTTISTTAGSTTAVTTLFTPTSAGTAALSSTTSPSMTNTTGSQNYTVSNPTATAYTTSLSAASGNVSVAVTMTFTPTAGGWPSSQTITPTTSSLTGTFSPTTITPTANSLSAVTCTFTPTASGAGSLDSTVAVSMTDTSGAQSYTVNASGPAYPTITTSGVTRLAVFDGNAGVTASSGNVSKWADQSGGGNDLTASVGVSVGASVNGYPSIAFASLNQASNSGLLASSGATWIGSTTGMENNNTVAFAIKTGATISGNGSEFVWVFSPSTYTGLDDYGVYIDTTGTLYFYIRRAGGYASTYTAIGTTAANTVYKVVLRKTMGSTSLDAWFNGTKTTYTIPSLPAFSSNGEAAFGIGQGPLSGYGNTGLTYARVLELHGMSGNLSDTDCATYATYLTNKWGS